MSPIQSKAPEYSSKYAVTADSHCMKIDLRYKKEDSARYTVLLVLRAAFHPQTTQEVISYSSWIESYKALNCDIVGVLRDSYESIHEWVMAPESEGGLANSQEFPIISDKAFPGLVSQLGVRTLESYGDNAIVIIDPLGKIRYWAAFPPDVGRGETLNIVASIREVDRNNGTVLTPADWMEGDPVIPNNKLGIDKFYSDNYGTKRSGILEMIKSVFSKVNKGPEKGANDTGNVNDVLHANKTDDISTEKVEILKAVMTNADDINQDGDEVLKKDRTGVNEALNIDKEHENVSKSSEIHVKNTKNIDQDEASVLESNGTNVDNIENKGQEEADYISNVAESGLSDKGNINQDDGVLKANETDANDTENTDHKKRDISGIDETDVSNISNDIETDSNNNKDIDQEDDALKDNETGSNQEEGYIPKSVEIGESDTKNIDHIDDILKSNQTSVSNAENLNKGESLAKIDSSHNENIEQEDNILKTTSENINQDILKADETGDNDTDSKDSNTKHDRSNKSLFSTLSDVFGSAYRPYHSSTPSRSSKKAKSSKKEATPKSVSTTSLHSTTSSTTPLLPLTNSTTSFKIII